MAEQNELPPKYYLEYFNYLLDFVQEKYRHILNENEWRFLRKYYCLSEDAQCLFIRFSNRKGLFFKINRLSYAELEDIPALLNELLEREFIEHVNADKHQTFGKELLGVFGKDELCTRFAPIIALSQEHLPKSERITYKKLKKDELVEAVLRDFSFEEIAEAVRTMEPIVKVGFEFEVTFMKFLFFWQPLPGHDRVCGARPGVDTI